MPLRGRQYTCLARIIGIIVGDLNEVRECLLITFGSYPQVSIWSDLAAVVLRYVVPDIRKKPIVYRAQVVPKFFIATRVVDQEQALQKQFEAKRCI